MGVRSLLAVALLVAVTACVTSAGAGIDVRDCSKGETRSALVSFVRAFNAGDYRRLNASFADASWFRWYSSNPPGQRRDPQAQQRGTLIRYFRTRHAQHDRFRLVSFTFNGDSGGYANFVWKMRRSASDFRGGAWFTAEAKGAAICDGPDLRFIVMSLGGPE